MRVKVVWLCGLLAACSSGAVTVPEGAGVYEVPQGGTASTAGGGDFTSTIEGALAEPTADGLPAHYPGARLPSADGTGPALDDDRINLMQWTLEQQKIDAAVAAARARRRAQPARRRAARHAAEPHRRASTSRSTPSRRPTPSASGSIDRGVGARVAGVGSCGRYRDADAAQRAFLAAGGPQSDRLRPRPRRRRLRLLASTPAPTARSTERSALGCSAGR